MTSYQKKDEQGGMAAAEVKPFEHVWPSLRAASYNLTRKPCDPSAEALIRALYERGVGLVGLVSWLYGAKVEQEHDKVKIRFTSPFLAAEAKQRYAHAAEVYFGKPVWFVAPRSKLKQEPEQKKALVIQGGE